MVILLVEDIVELALESILRNEGKNGLLIKLKKLRLLK